MSYKVELAAFAKNIRTLQKYIRNRETVRQSLVVPFFKILGWDVYNPGEFMAGYAVETPHGKTLVADFAILKNDLPLILIQTYFEEGSFAEEYAKLAALYRLVATDKIAIITNGIDWRFFADGNEVGVLDPEPYLTLNLGEKTRAEDLAVLDPYHKEVFDLTPILKPLRIGIYEKKIAEYFMAQRAAETADSELIEFIIKKVHPEPEELTEKGRQKMSTWIVNAFAVIPPKNNVPRAATGEPAAASSETLEEIEVVRPVKGPAMGISAPATGKPLPEGRLTVIAGDDKGKSVTVQKKEFFVGRNLDLDFVLTDPAVSRRHFRIFFEGDSYWVEDLGSGNKIKINGVKTTQRHRLVHNDIIQAGNTTLRFESYILS